MKPQEKPEDPDTDPTGAQISRTQSHGGPGDPGDPGVPGPDQRGPQDPAPTLFIQLNELLGGPQAPEWKETARWLRFEEKLELGGARWSSPHVPTLPLHSLLALRRALLAGGLVLPDCPSWDLPQLIEQVMGLPELGPALSPELRARLASLLLQRPEHHIPATWRRLLTHLGSPACWGSAHSRQDPTAGKTPQEEQRQNPLEQKLPPGTEAAVILAGELDFLERPLTAFVCLRAPQVLGTLVEVPLRIRFVCILLGPPGRPRGYHELGRAVAVLLSDQLFQWSARRARGPQDLVAGIDAFLDDLTVLPPGKWDPTARLPPPRCLPPDHRSPAPHPETHCDRRLPPELRENQAACNGKVLRAADRRGHQAEPSEELRRTGRLFGGLAQDVRRKAPWYLSDFLDGLDVQCFSAVLYIYLATVTNAITFGGMLSDATGNFQGVLESFLGTSVAGATFCLFAGQPLTILSSTGPILVFERLLFSFCRDHGLDYMPFRLWVGIWVATFCLALVATEASYLVRYFTRFTEEGFCALISLIFIYDAVRKLLSLAELHPFHRPDRASGFPLYSCLCHFPAQGGEAARRGTLAANASLWNQTRPAAGDGDLVLGTELGLVNVSLLLRPECLEGGGRLLGPGCPYVPDVAFLSVLLFLSTFFSAMILKHFKSSPFFPTTVRKAVSDFSIILAILLGCGLDAAFGLDTPKLIVPSEFKPTHPGRGWLVPLFGANAWWLCPAAALPAVLLAILVFMDQQITAVILNRKEYRLQKGAGFHLDLFWVAMLMLLTSAVGLPWYVSATVISLAHMDSLKRESSACIPGEPARFLGIREQRLTGLLVFILTGVSVFLAPILKFIPMPVLYGIFLYMGVAALSSLQLVERVQLLLVPAKHQPDLLLLLRHVPLRRVHLFTAVQLLCLAGLWLLKATAAAIVFPLMLLGLVGIRKALERVFSQQELTWLDEPMPEPERAWAKDEEEQGEEEEEEEEELPPRLEPGESGSEDSELLYQPKGPEINISVN
ncbi:LOW QUALITY PROTEIN: anion exchange protein 4 [Tachyglossus aculeatus]|uniref:LOW QUALITY PROTEIN: anion exchange protein 4 n=1 Tax=Tachyglossus aculeatus TaxID=9261 RepID=UPI0018F603FD|nr:LOW QUALITY PROTEIN: anion exchange protein 4 [Tachyglossus aculeatus]